MLLGVGADEAVKKFVELQEEKFLPWSSIYRGLFVEGFSGPTVALVDISHQIRALAAERKNEAIHSGGVYIAPNVLNRYRIHSDDALADIVLAQFGDYPAKPICPLDYEGFVNRMLSPQYVDLSDRESFPGDYFRLTSPLDVTQQGLLAYTGGRGFDTPGLFIGDQTLTRDLVAFWNLRVAGRHVVFLPSVVDSRLAGVAIEAIKDAEDELKDDPPAFRKPAVWYTDETFVEAYKELFPSGRAIYDLREPLWDGAISSPRVHLEEESVLGAISEVRDKISISVALPKRPFEEEFDSGFQHLAVSVRLFTEPNPQQGVFKVPYLPALNEYYGRNAHFDYAAARSEREGLGIIIQRHDAHLTLYGIPPRDLITRIFELAGIKAKPSTAGKIASRMIQQMGGVDACRVFKIRGVRDLLRKFKISRSFTHAQALEIIGPTVGPHKDLYIEQRERRPLRAQDVFLHLVKKEIIRPGLEFECPRCELRDWHSLDDVGEKVDCPFCGEKIQAGVQLKDGAWHYRVSGLFGRTQNDEGAVPVILTLLQALRCLHSRGMTWLTAMDLEWEDGKTSVVGETDFAVLTRNFDDQTQLLLGECKTNMEIEEAQIVRLKTVSQKLRDVGVKTFVTFSKSERGFTDQELALIDLHQTVDFNFILLTPSELEPYHPYENMKHRKIRSVAPHTLDEWASNSRTLYLKSTDDEIFERSFNTTHQKEQSDA